MGGQSIDDAFAAALRALGRRERSASEMRRLMARRGLSTEELEAVMTRLEETGAVDDQRFARRFTEDKRTVAGWGAKRIRAGLQARGIAAALIEEALAGDGERSELDRAIDALAARGGPLTTDPERQRALAFLVRRGYDLDLAYEAVRSFMRTAA